MPIHARPDFWILETQHSAYACGLNQAGRLAHAYWGARLPHADDYPAPPNAAPYASFNGPEHRTPHEYPAWAGLDYSEPCLKLHFADGVRDAVLVFDSAEQPGPEELRLTLRDAHYPLRLTLVYRVHSAFDLIERHAELTNLGDAPITLERAFSACWHLPPGEGYHLRHLNGRWLDEWQLIREPLARGVKALESRRLTTSHHHNPWWTLDRDASETHGEVFFGALGWSGNWKLLAEVSEFSRTRLLIGLNDWDFAWTLVPGEIFATPPAYAGYTCAGYGGASQALHGFIRAHLPHPEQPRPVLYNSWEATLFNIDLASQQQLAEEAAALGVELFVMDDGWFKGRRHDRAGLGDWTPDPERFPDGLQPLIDHVHQLGMRFGLWVEPEMVNPDSDLYRQHPDWVIHFPTRARSEARNQLILNCARPDVQDYLIDALDRLLSQHDIAFIKWDMNRNVSEPGWPDAPRDAREIWLRYVQGVYRIWGTLRQRHPQVLFQSCSGGGGRADLGILRYADQIWVSDNTMPAARLRMHEGFSQCFPACTMEAWVTRDEFAQQHQAAYIPLDYRFHVNMLGVLGLGMDLKRLNAEERAEARQLIALYKKVRPLVQFGVQHRLASLADGPYSAWLYASPDQREAVCFVFRSHAPDPAQPFFLRLRGLDPAARYTVEGFAGARSGAAWMSWPLEIELPNFGSRVLRIRRAD